MKGFVTLLSPCMLTAHRGTTMIIKFLVFTMLAIICTANASQSIPTINIHKIKSSELLTGPYSYFVPPYNYYYFHNMDKLDFKLDWIRRAGTVYPLKETTKSFSAKYTYKNHTY